MGFVFTPIDKSTNVASEETVKSENEIIRTPSLKFMPFEEPIKSVEIQEPKESLPSRVIDFFTKKPDPTKIRGFDNVKELWETPLGLSEKLVKESRETFGNTDTIMGKLNSVIIEGGIKYGDLALRTAATPFVYGTGIAGDMMQSFESIFNATPFSPKTAGDKFNEDLLGILTMGMGLGRGTFRPSTITVKGKQVDVLKSIETGEVIKSSKDLINIKRRGGRTKEQIIKQVRQANEEAILKNKQQEIIKTQEDIAINQQVAQVETNLALAKAERNLVPIETVKPIEPKITKNTNYVTQLDDAFTRKDLDLSPQVNRDNIAQRQIQKGLDFAHNIAGYALSPLGKLPRKSEYLKARYGTMGKLIKVDEIGNKIFNTFKDLNPQVKEQIKNYLVTKEATLDIIPNSIPKEIANAAFDIKKAIEKVGDELVKRKLLSKEVVDQNRGSYLAQKYLKYLDKPTAFGYTKERQNLSEAEKLILGEITDPTILAPLSITQPARDIVYMDFLNELGEANDWAYQPSLVEYSGYKVSPVWLQEEAARITNQVRTTHNFFSKEERDQLLQIAEEMDTLGIKSIAEQRNLPEVKSGEVAKYFKQLPSTKKYGTMAGAMVRKEIVNDLVDYTTLTGNPESFIDNLIGPEGYLTRTNQLWKMSKVVLNPPTQVRNFISNMVLLNTSGVPLPMVPIRIIEAAKDIANNGPYYEIAVKYGVPQTTFSNREVLKLTSEFERLIKKYNKPENALGWINKTGWMLADNPITRPMQKMYGFSETLGKTAKIIDEMKKGATEGDAVLAAQEALFDYSLVPPFIEGIRKSPLGSPFITFTYKAAPQVLNNMLKRPFNTAKYLAIPTAMAYYVANQFLTTQEDSDNLNNLIPKFMQEKGSAFILPIKDSYGRWQAMDLSYFLPWSIFTESINQTKDMINNDVDRLGDLWKNTGLVGGLIPNLITAYSANKDPFTNRQIWFPQDPSSKQIADKLSYAYNLMMPSFLGDYGTVNKIKKHIEGDVDYYGDPTKDLTSSILTAFGVNLYPINTETQPQKNIYNMTKAIAEIESRMRKILRDQNSSDEEKEKQKEMYIKIIEDRIEQLDEYQESIKISNKLRTNNNKEIN